MVYSIMDKSEVKKQVYSALDEAKMHSERLSELIAEAKQTRQARRGAILEQISACKKDWSTAMSSHSQALRDYIKR